MTQNANPRSASSPINQPPDYSRLINKADMVYQHAERCGPLVAYDIFRELWSVSRRPRIKRRDLKHMCICLILADRSL